MLWIFVQGVDDEINTRAHGGSGFKYSEDLIYNGACFPLLVKSVEFFHGDGEGFVHDELLPETGKEVYRSLRLRFLMVQVYAGNTYVAIAKLGPQVMNHERPWGG
jgi:hypothetical protein